MTDLKDEVEALLFSSGRRMTVEELSIVIKRPQEEILEALKALGEKYRGNPPIVLLNEGIYWKLTIHDQHLDLVKNIVTQTELSKTLMETLAVIAFKYPIKQSDLIKIRTNKAYDHLSELENMGYITRQKYGRTKLIKLTQKFFDYFDLPREKLKEAFKDFEGIAKAIGEKEEEVKQIKEEQKKQAEESGKEIDLIDSKGHKKKLETFDVPQKEIEEEQAKGVEVVKDKLGSLEVVDEPEQDEPEEEQLEEQEEMPEKAPEDFSPEEEQEIEARARELEKKISEKADEIMTGVKREKSDIEKREEELLSNNEDNEPEEKPKDSSEDSDEEKEEK